jgi:hypothetical protein
MGTPKLSFADDYLSCTVRLTPDREVSIGAKGIIGLPIWAGKSVFICGWRVQRVLLE